jgi:hypothetical protein
MRICIAWVRVGWRRALPGFVGDTAVAWARNVYSTGSTVSFTGTFEITGAVLPLRRSCHEICTGVQATAHMCPVVFR